MKINNIQARVATLEPIGDHLEIKVEQTYDNQFFQSQQQSEDGKGYLKLRISLDTAIKLAEFIDRELEDLYEAKMSVGV